MSACSDDAETNQTFDSVISPGIAFNDSEEIIAGITSVDFSNITTVEGTDIASYFWHFGFSGEGNWTEDVDPAPVIYKQPGEYTVTLTVWGKDGNRATTTRVITVFADNVAPVAAFSYSPETVTVDTSVIFTDESTDEDGRVVSRLWTLPDGTTATEATVTYTFTKMGIQQVTLSVTDDRGKTSRVAKAISIRSSAEITDLTVNWATPVTVSIVNADASAVAVSDMGYIYFTSCEGKIVALDAGGDRAWSYDATADGVVFDYVAYPSVDTDGTVYWAASGDEKVGTTPAYVYAFDGATGEPRWKLLWGDPGIYDESNSGIEQNAAGDFFSYSTPAILSNYIVIAGRGSKTQITFLDKQTGKKSLWVNPKNGRAPGPVVCLNNYTMFHSSSSSNGYGVLVPSTTSESIWDSSSWTAYGRADTYTANNVLKANYCQLCIDANGNVYFAGTPGSSGNYNLACAPVASFRPGAAKVTWSVKLDGGFTRSGASLSADGSTLYIVSGSEPYAVHAVNTSNGASLWSYPLDADQSTSVPAVDNLGQIHLCTMGGYYIVLNQEGQEVYKEKVADSINGSPTLSPAIGSSYFAGTDAAAGCLKVYSLSFPGVTGPANSAWAQYGQNAGHCQHQK